MVDLKTAAVVVGAGAAGLILLSRTDAGAQIGVEMPEIKMPDIMLGIDMPSIIPTTWTAEGVKEALSGLTGLFPDIKIPEFPSLADLPLPTAEGIKSVIQPLLDKIPTLTDIKGMVPGWVYDPPSIPELTGLEKVREVIQTKGILGFGGLSKFFDVYKEPVSWVEQAVAAPSLVPIEEKLGEIKQQVGDAVARTTTALLEYAR